MAYQALYRKWRPSNFEEVKGQDHIVTTLKNQIEMNRIGHAYLFCGTRGTGKTSIAKIFAKAVNCEHPVNGSPCNECAMCRAVNEQRSMNVIEIRHPTTVLTISVRFGKKWRILHLRASIRFILSTRCICSLLALLMRC